jgi:hypothetical protein
MKTCQRRTITDAVTLINAFEVPEGQEEVFLTHWQEAAD